MSRRPARRYGQPLQTPRAPDPETSTDEVMAELGELTMQLARAVEKIKRAVPDDKDFS